MSQVGLDRGSIYVKLEHTIASSQQHWVIITTYLCSYIFKKHVKVE